jgi:hypothetical protein
MPSNLSHYNPFEVDAGIIIQDKNAWEVYVKKIDNLPEPIRDIIYDITTVEFLIDVAEEFKLTKPQSTELTRIIRNVLVGDTYLGSITRDISNRLKLPEEISLDIARKILNGLFQKALEDIKLVQKEKFPGKFKNSNEINLKEESEPKIPYQASSQNVSKNNIINLRDKK